MCISKSTSFSCMAGLKNDKILCAALSYELRKAGIQFIYQEPSMLQHKGNITKKTRKLEIIAGNIIFIFNVTFLTLHNFFLYFFYILQKPLTLINRDQSKNKFNQVFGHTYVDPRLISSHPVLQKTWTTMRVWLWPQACNII